MDALYSNPGCEAAKSKVVVDKRSSDAWPGWDGSVAVEVRKLEEAPDISGRFGGRAFVDEDIEKSESLGWREE